MYCNTQCVRKININHEEGGMAADLNFIVDTSSIQKKNTVGPAGPHQIFFDPASIPGGGFHLRHTQMANLPNNRFAN